MTSHKGSPFSSTSWGLPGPRRWPRGAFPGLVDGTVLLAVWMALWAVFVLGVVEPAAQFRGAAVRAAAQVERSGT
ncbi:MAG TPA: hypothetical protein VIV59_14265 [Anaeromyxobacteraceae bacterium]